MSVNFAPDGPITSVPVMQDLPVFERLPYEKILLGCEIDALGAPLRALIKI